MSTLDTSKVIDFVTQTVTTPSTVARFSTSVLDRLQCYTVHYVSDYGQHWISVVRPRVLPAPSFHLLPIRQRISQDRQAVITGKQCPLVSRLTSLILGMYKNHGKKSAKSRHNHGVQFTAQYALIKSLFYCISVTNYHRSHAAPFGARHKELKYYRTKKMQLKLFSLWLRRVGSGQTLYRLRSKLCNFW